MASSLRTALSGRTAIWAGFLTVLAIWAGVLIPATASGPVRATAGALGLLGVFLYGYVVYRAIFGNNQRDWVEVLAMSLGLDVALSIAGGLLLNLTPGGLTSRAWAIFVSTVSLSCVLILLVRRSGRRSSAAGVHGAALPVRPSTRAVVWLLAAGTLCTLGYVADSVSASNHLEPVSSAWINSDATMNARHLRVGVTVRRGQREARTVRVACAPGRSGQQFSLPPNVSVSWSREITVPRGCSGQRVRVTLLDHSARVIATAFSAAPTSSGKTPPPKYLSRTGSAAR